jgi:hypothetical protein
VIAVARLKPSRYAMKILVTPVMSIRVTMPRSADQSRKIIGFLAFSILEIRAGSYLRVLGSMPRRLTSSNLLILIRKRPVSRATFGN